MRMERKKVMILISILVIISLLSCGIFEFTRKEKDEKEKYVAYAVPGYSYVPTTHNGKIVFINSIAWDPITMNRTEYSDFPYSPYSFIEIYDIKQRKTAVIEAPFVLGPVMIYGNTIVWKEILKSEGTSISVLEKIYVCDLNAMKKKPVMEKESKNIYGELIVYGIFEDKILINDQNINETDSKFYRLYLYNITTNNKEIVDEGSDIGNGGIYRDMVVYTKSGRDNNDGIYVYDMGKKKSSIVKTVEDLCGWATYDTHLVYIEHKDDFYGVYLYDLEEKRETLLSTDKREKYSPSIWEDKVVWEEFSDVWEEFSREETENMDKWIVLYNLTTHEKKILYKLENFLSPMPIPFLTIQMPQIYDNIVVWQEPDPEQSRSARIRYIDLNESKINSG